jgi:hypothetical protein
MLHQLPLNLADDVANDEDHPIDENATSEEEGPESDNNPDAEQWERDFSKKGIHLVHINARSLRHKTTELSILAQRTRASVIAVSETWLDTSVLNAEVSLPGYNIIRKDRGSHGGGVCLYIKEDLAFNPRADLDDTQLEIVWIDLLLKKTKPILIGCAYRPPGQQNFVEL